MKKTILISLLFIILYSLNAQKDSLAFQVKGRIIDSINNESVPFSTISIYKLPEKTVVKRLAADMNGKFNFIIDSAASYTMIISSIGFSPYEMELLLIRGENEIDLGKILVSGAATELDGVEIVAQKQLIKLEANKVIYNVEVDPDAHASTALEMLRNVPFLSIDGEDNVLLKGASNFKVYLNGKLSIMLTRNPKEILKSIPASNIKRVEVITSPGAKYDAEGIGGIIDIVTYKRMIFGTFGSVNVGVDNLGRINCGATFSTSLGKLVFSLNFGGTHFNNNRTKNRIESKRENYNIHDAHTINTFGESEFESIFGWGNGNFSYEIDSLNLISASFSFFAGDWNSKDEIFKSIYNSENELYQSFNMNNPSNNTWKQPSGNIDYQRIAKRNKEEVLTLSYKLENSPEKQIQKQTIDSVYNYNTEKRNFYSKERSTEHTFQADYVYPVLTSHKIELGSKYIRRINKSIDSAQVFNLESDNYEPDTSQYSDFKHNQEIIAAYIAFQGKINKFGFIGGLRCERACTKGIVLSDKNPSFDNTSFEFVPSCSFSFQYSQRSSFQLSYSKRIQRPSIWYLNPYVDDSNPQSIRYGNPFLDPEHYHSIEFNHNQFMKSGNINFGVSYSFTNNGIDRLSWVENDILYSTYENIVTKKTYYISANLNFRIRSNFNFNANLGANYSDITNNDNTSQGNSGWGNSFYLRGQYEFKTTYKLSFYGGYNTPSVRLQSEMSSFKYYGVSIKKEFYDGKFSISAGANNFLEKEMTFNSTMSNEDFYFQSYYFRPNRSFSINIYYKFGKMTKSVRKTKRGIINDDVKEGEKENN
ncbi:TonB-dependent receptor [Lentimicrobium sp. L6]|uniref:outer membrane beta-barrel family protein n=1 Tax=Lentimicrobium sp. L6 TaxID=2735916 RepID=UPI0015571169|nr:outer membrane beta-barrel family protein [Lentimicrobium sp. L6]NPD85840.1 TonB-dependent receptor [Lentimicrobium sp. L6]